MPRENKKAPENRGFFVSWASTERIIADRSASPSALHQPPRSRIENPPPYMRRRTSPRSCRPAVVVQLRYARLRIELPAERQCHGSTERRLRADVPTALDPAPGTFANRTRAGEQPTFGRPGPVRLPAPSRRATCLPSHCHVLIRPSLASPTPAP